MLVHSRQRRPTAGQYWAVFYAGISISTEHTLTLIRRRLIVRPASPALAGIHSTSGSASCWLGAWLLQWDYKEPCRLTYDTPNQCRLNVGPPYVTPIQPQTSIISQRMSTRRKICWLKAARVFSGTKARAFNPKVGLILGKWRKQRPNIEPELRQHVD